MKVLLLVMLMAILGRVVWWWFVARNRPVYPPLAIEDNDPLMVAALNEAKDKVPQLLELFEDAKGFTRVKIPFRSNSGQIEHLWAELLEVEANEIHVRYLTPPVTHTGKLARLHTHPITDIEDWVVTKNPKKYIGGYSMRVMFKRGKEQWGGLPPELKAEEEKYG